MTRVAIIGGTRTPFVRAGTVFSQHSFIDLGIHAVKSLIEKIDLDPTQIDELAYSTVLLDPRAPNFAREIVLRSGLPGTLCAHSMSNNCISGLVALTYLGDAIKSERIKVGVGGGSESMSRPALSFSPDAEKFFLSLSRAKDFKTRLAILSGFSLKYGLPVPPSPKEPSTGKTMGHHAEMTAQELSITRVEQDEIAYRSHTHASEATANGILSEEIAPLDGIKTDTIIRSDTSLDRLAKLKPVFDKSEKGTITAGNSSPLTDGASAIALASESAANRLNKKILGYIEAVEFAAIAPSDGLLMAPVFALPRLLAKANLRVEDVDLFEIHEAFGAQVAANLKVWREGWARFPQLKPLGTIPTEKINVNGSSIAVGHPFAATGGRLVLSLVNELNRRNLNTGVLSVCAAGGMACAMLIRRT